MVVAFEGFEVLGAREAELKPSTESGPEGGCVGEAGRSKALVKRTLHLLPARVGGQEAAEHVYRQREHDRRVLLRGDRVQRLQQRRRRRHRLRKEGKGV